MTRTTAGLVAAGVLGVAMGALAQGPRYAVRVETAPMGESGTGDFDAQAVIRTLEARRSAIRACVERAARDGDAIPPETVITLTIPEDGHVSDVVLSGSGAWATCVERVGRGLRFVPGPEGGSVTYSIVLHFDLETSPPAPPGGGS